MKAPLWLAAALVALALSGCMAGPDATVFLDFGDHTRSFVVTLGDDRPSASYYAAEGLQHPGPYTAFDATVAATREGHAVLEVQHSSFGFYLVRIDGFPNDPSAAYWSLVVNGETSQVGMEQVLLEDGDRIEWVLTPLNTFRAPTKVELGAVPAETRNKTFLLTGEVDGLATINIVRPGGGVMVPAIGLGTPGTWEVEVPLEPGHNPMLVLVDDGLDTQAFAFNVTRLVPATVEVRYNVYSDQADSVDEVWYDPSAPAAVPMYAEAGAEHTGSPVVHDLVVAWELQTGNAVTYGHHPSFGFSVERINGAGNPLTSSLPPWWCYQVDGQSAAQGISLQPLVPGMTVTWDLGTCSG
jgi:hypothetical protein